jgi:hypothetical protein
VAVEDGMRGEDAEGAGEVGVGVGRRTRLLGAESVSDGHGSDEGGKNAHGLGEERLVPRV